jgi:hypothetical protein
MKNLITLLMLLILLIASSLYAATLRLQVVDETGQPTGGRLEVRGEGERCTSLPEPSGISRPAPTAFGRLIWQASLCKEIASWRFLLGVTASLPSTGPNISAWSDRLPFLCLVSPSLS